MQCNVKIAVIDVCMVESGGEGGGGIIFCPCKSHKESDICIGS
jgi:hypothetical protein